MAEAWELGYTGKGVTIAIMDDGGYYSAELVLYGSTQLNIQFLNYIWQIKFYKLYIMCNVPVYRTSIMSTDKQCVLDIGLRVISNLLI